MNIDPETFNLPPWWLDAVLIWLALLGVILWFLGVKLVRPVLGLIGLAGGAGLAAAFVEARFPDAIAWPWIIAGAAMFAVTAYLMWRLLVAVMLGGTVALVMLSGVMLRLVWEIDLWGRLRSSASIGMPAGIGPGKGARSSRAAIDAAG